MTGRAPKNLRFTKMRLKNWRNFRDVNLFLEKRAIFVGPNASGKSNLLDSIRFLSELAVPGSGGLQAAVQARGGFSSLRCLHSRAPSYLEIEVHIGNDDEEVIWRYFLRINVLKKMGKLPIVLREEIEHRGVIEKHREFTPKSSPLEFSQTFLEQVQISKDFKDLGDFLKSCRYLHVVPQIVRDPARARAEGDDPYGGDLLRRMKNTPKRTRDVRMRKISDALRLAVPQFKGIELDENDAVPHLLATYEHWRFTATKQNEVAFSDGTLRLIGLLWSIAEKGGPLLLEEPELSLNDAVVSELPRMFARMQKFSGRQVITTTHSSSLLDDRNIGLKEVHRISVDASGSSVETLVNNDVVSAQVRGGMTISEAVLPLLRPKGIERLGILDVAG